MNLLKPILRIGSRFQEIEFSLLLVWTLLFPAKQSYLYYFGFTVLLTLFSLKKIFTMKNISFMRVSVFLLLFNLLLIGSAFFSLHAGQSLFFVCNTLLLSIWFFLFDIEKIDVHRYLRLLAYALSLASLAIVVFSAFPAGRGLGGLIFQNPVLQGIAAALAVLFFLQSLLHKFTHADMALLLVNGGAVIISASRAVFLGLALFSAAMILARKRKWIVYFAGFMLLLLLIADPLKRPGGQAINHNPNAHGYMQIWNMSARMFRACFWTGVGPDLFMEAARRFYFPVKKGPARYAEQPGSPHSDYWKIICENGIAGLSFVLLFLFFTIRRMLAPPWMHLPKVLLAFLMLQMLFINFIFDSFFLLVFLFLLYSFFWRRLFYISLAPAFKIFLSGVLLLVFFIFYLLPLGADRLLQTAAAEKNIVRRFALLNRAAIFSPLDDRVPLARAKILRGFFKNSASLEAWEAAWEDSRMAQKLNRNSSEACILESGLFADLLEKGIMYPALAEEIVTPLRRAEKLEPFNPFLKLRQALVLYEFGRRREALNLTRAALDLEPDYVAALFFMQRLSGSAAGDPGFQKRIAQIQAKAKALQAKLGSYLYNLYSFPKKSGTEL